MTEKLSRTPLALIANHHQWSARSLDSILAPAGFSVLRSVTSDDALEQIRNARPDVVVLDLALLETGGIELCRLLRIRGEIDPTTPILLTSAEPITRETRMSALRAGAWECVAFPLDAEELLLKLRVFLESKFDADSLRDNALLDPFTGFYSARGLLRRARELGAEAGRHARALGCVVLAPAAPGPGERMTSQLEPGADVLRHMSRVLELHGRSSDSIGRLSQLEFVVLAPDTDREGVVRLAERLAKAASRTALAATRKPLGLLAGCYAVEDFNRARIEPVELMVRATLALRRAQAEPTDQPIRFFRAGMS
jgi:PleD family two-component response regulator